MANINTNGFIIAAISIIVSIILITGVLIPVIGDATSDEKNGKEVNDFATWLENAYGVSSDYYNSYQVYWQDVTSSSAPNMTWTKDDFKDMTVVGDGSVYVPVIDGVVFYADEKMVNGSPVTLDRPTFLYSHYTDEVTDIVISETESFEIKLQNYEYVVKYKIDGEEHTDTLSIITDDQIIYVKYLSPNKNGWVTSQSDIFVTDGSRILVMWSLYGTYLGGWIGYDEEIEFDETKITNNVYTYTLNLKYNGTDYGQFNITFPVVPVEDKEGVYKFAYDNGYFLENGGTITSLDGTRELIVSGGESWIDSVSIRNIDPYTYITPTVSPTTASMLSVIPLIVIVGLIVGTVGYFLRKQ